MLHNPGANTDHASNQEENSLRTGKRQAVAKAVCFLLIFVVLWLVLQRILDYKYTDSRELLHDRYRHFEQEPQGTIDVLYMGSSSMDSGINPAVVYRETGITGYNFSIHYNSAFMTYYNVRYAFEHHIPRLLVLDLSDIHFVRDPKVMTYYEATYRKSIENMPDFRLRMEMLMAYQREFGVNDTMEYLLPLLRYHDRWKNLTLDDFLPGAYSSSDYQPFLKGAYMREDSKDQTERPAFTARQDNVEASQVSLSYYRRIVQLCRDNGVEVMVVAIPRMMMNPNYLECAIAFCEENNLNILYYLDKESIHAIGIDEKDCFYDTGHMNTRGQLAYSRTLAREIMSLYDLEDHRGDPAYAAWDEAYAAYYDSYGASIGAQTP